MVKNILSVLLFTIMVLFVSCSSSQTTAPSYEEESLEQGMVEEVLEDNSEVLENNEEPQEEIDDLDEILEIEEEVDIGDLI